MRRRVALIAVPETKSIEEITTSYLMRTVNFPLKAT